MFKIGLKMVGLKWYIVPRPTIEHVVGRILSIIIDDYVYRLACFLQNQRRIAVFGPTTSFAIDSSSSSLKCKNYSEIHSSFGSAGFCDIIVSMVKVYIKM
jgi:hypothetical protein